MRDKPQTEADVHAMVLGALIAGLRSKTPITQPELAKRVGIRQYTLSRIERGRSKPDAYTCKRLAEALGLSHAEFDQRVDLALEWASKVPLDGISPVTAETWWKTALAVGGELALAGIVLVAVGAVIERGRR